MDKDSVSFFILAYNEEENIIKVLDQADKVLKDLTKDYEILVVYYSGSTDNTEKIVKAYIKTRPHVRIIPQPANKKGYGEAMKLGIGNAKKRWIGYTDGDNQFAMSDMKRLFQLRNTADIIIGYRKNRKDPLMRILAATIYNYVIWMLFQFKVRDVDCAFKLYDSKIFSRINLISSSGLIDAEVLIKAKRLGYALRQIPVTHYPRLGGKPIFEGFFNGMIHPKVVFELFREMSQLLKDLKKRNA